MNSSEILIGHNTDNMRCRNSILKIYDKCKKIALIGQTVVIIISAVLSIIAKMPE